MKTGIELDEPRFSIKANGRAVNLAPKEWDILVLLKKADGRVLSREDIMNQIWGEAHVPDTRTVDQHVARLRRKLGPSAEAIQTIHTRGYKFAQ